MTKSWRIDEFAPEAAAFYGELTQRFGPRFHHGIPAVRFCLNPEDAKRAGRRLRNPRYAKVLSSLQPPGAEGPLFKDSDGSICIDQAAWVDLPAVIDCLRQNFSQTGQWVDSDFVYDGLRKSDGGWHYDGVRYDRVIFCEGAALTENPWFRHLPLHPVKGETLHVRSPGVDLAGKLYHHGKWLLPYEDSSFRIGATYDESDRSANTTPQGKQQLIEAFDRMWARPQPLEILQQSAGIRPSTKDARPFLGAHTEHAGLYVFNGLGSKGASLAPTLSRELVGHILDGTPLHPETDIKRWAKVKS